MNRMIFAPDHVGEDFRLAVQRLLNDPSPNPTFTITDYTFGDRVLSAVVELRPKTEDDARNMASVDEVLAS